MPAASRIAQTDFCKEKLVKMKRESSMQMNFQENGDLLNRKLADTQF